MKCYSSRSRTSFRPDWTDRSTLRQKLAAQRSVLPPPTAEFPAGAGCPAAENIAIFQGVASFVRFAGPAGARRRPGRRSGVTLRAGRNFVTKLRAPGSSGPGLGRPLQPTRIGLRSSGAGKGCRGIAICQEMSGFVREFRACTERATVSPRPPSRGPESPGTTLWSAPSTSSGQALDPGSSLRSVRGDKEGVGSCHEMSCFVMSHRPRHIGRSPAHGRDRAGATGQILAGVMKCQDSS